MSYPPAGVLASCNLHGSRELLPADEHPVTLLLHRMLAGSGECRRGYAIAYGRSGNNRDPLPLLLDAMRDQVGRGGWSARPRALARLPHQPGEALPEGLDSSGAAGPPGPVDRAVAPGRGGRPAASG